MVPRGRPLRSARHTRRAWRLLRGLAYRKAKGTSERHIIGNRLPVCNRCNEELEIRPRGEYLAVSTVCTRSLKPSLTSAVSAIIALNWDSPPTKQLNLNPERLDSFWLTQAATLMPNSIEKPPTISRNLVCVSIGNGGNYAAGLFAVETGHAYNSNTPSNDTFTNSINGEQAHPIVGERVSVLKAAKDIIHSQAFLWRQPLTGCRTVLATLNAMAYDKNNARDELTIAERNFWCAWV